VSYLGLIDTWGHQVDIETVTNTVDAGGSPVRAFSINQRGVRCLIVSSGVPELTEAGRPISNMSATGYFAPSVSIGTTDRVVWKDGNDTRTFEVTAKREPLGLKSSNHMSKIIVNLEQVE
jgi:hypothetical protein